MKITILLETSFIFFPVIKPDGAGDIIMKHQSECAIDNSQCTSFAFCHEPNLSLQDLVMTLLNNEEKLLMGNL